MNDPLNTEEKILEAAKRVFVRSGFEGTSMQKIADEAGINKALLHYYYRSKEKLFEQAFSKIFRQFVPRAQEIFNSEIDFFDKIRLFVSTYIDLLVENPLVPGFILQEINRNPNILYHIITQAGVNPSFFFIHAEKEIAAGNIVISSSKHLFINIMSLCIFPIAARPLMQKIVFQNDQRSYEIFLEDRKTEVSDFIINAIKRK
ncbi:MAG: TetR/AcrR family transcriptional regulator [Bacteroidota bacterium]|nr:TetR/AcrR family transcriptional regulator [Bacteroidota bacterium]